MPRYPRETLPRVMSWSTIDSMVPSGMAKLMPADWPSVVPWLSRPVAMATFIPMMRPLMSTSGPPELPGVPGAAGWEKLGKAPDLAPSGAFPPQAADDALAHGELEAEG